MLPSSLAEERRNELEAEMVAVQDKILKATKMLPSNLTWNGKPDTLSSFVERFEEWVEILMGADAALVLAGKQHDEHGDATMASCLYTTWSRELYLLLRGRLTKDSADTLIWGSYRCKK